jgi:hypothetical protein
MVSHNAAYFAMKNGIMWMCVHASKNDTAGAIPPRTGVYHHAAAESNRDRCRRRWLARDWRVSKRGNFWLALGDYHVVVFGHRAGRWRARVTYLPSKEWWVGPYFDTIEDARLAALPLLDKVRRQVNRYLRDHPNAFPWRTGGPRPSADSPAGESSQTA